MHASKCAANKFTVAVYNNGNPIRTTETADHEAIFSDLPICVPLIAGVRGHNELGEGEETRTVFTISG
ncbi:hypothetical protein T265_15968, partial [Opisthorchis viverrini]